jgi:hypothetical protein
MSGPWRLRWLGASKPCEESFALESSALARRDFLTMVLTPEAAATLEIVPPGAPQAPPASDQGELAL